MAASTERRSKWARQIKQIIDQLRETDVVWGNGKMEDVFINSTTNNVCSIKFGGSFTKGWVDRD